MQNTFEQVNEIIDNLEIIIKNNVQVAQIEKDILLEKIRKIYIQVIDLAVQAEENAMQVNIVKEVPVEEEKMEDVENQVFEVEHVTVEPDVLQMNMAHQNVENDTDRLSEDTPEKELIQDQEPQPVELKKEEVMVSEEPDMEVSEEVFVEPQVQVLESKIENTIEEIKKEEAINTTEEERVSETLPSDEDDLLQFIPKNEPKPAVQVPISQVQPQRSLNDLFNEQKDHSLSAQYQNAKVVDLTKAISINDKFTYIKELFNNKGEEFSAAIQSLNQCLTIDDAFDCLENLKKKYYWDSTSTAYLSLCDLLRRKF